MNVAVLYFPPSDNDRKLTDIAKGVAEGLESQGHRVELINGTKDTNKKLTVYKYLVIGTSAVNTFGGKIPKAVGVYLANAGMITGKRSCAFVTKTGMRKEKTLQTLMKTMEHEGMYLKYSEIITSPEMGKEIGKRLHIE